MFQYNTKGCRTTKLGQIDASSEGKLTVWNAWGRMVVGFKKKKAPPCPHHPYRHCTLEPISYAVFWWIQHHIAITVNSIHTYLIPEITISTERTSMPDKGVHKGMQGGFAMNAILRTVGLSIFLNTVKGWYCNNSNSRRRPASASRWNACCCEWGD